MSLMMRILKSDSEENEQRKIEVLQKEIEYLVENIKIRKGDLPPREKR